MEFQKYYYKCKQITELDTEIIEQIKEIESIISNLNEDDLIDSFESFSRKKSISSTLQNILRTELRFLNWEENKKIFITSEKSINLNNNRWSVDYYKNNCSLEISFLHEMGTALTLFKGALTILPNHLPRNMTSKISIIITVNNLMKKIGGFDNSIASFEKYIEYLNAFQDIINYPILLFGIDSPKKFKIIHNKKLNMTIGKVKKI